MVTRKYRYIAFELSNVGDAKSLQEKSIVQYIRDRVNEMYGESGLYRLNNISLIKYLRQSSIAVIRIDSDIEKMLLSSVKNMTVNSLTTCQFTPICKSGILKKALKKLHSFILKEEENI